MRAEGRDTGGKEVVELVFIEVGTVRMWGGDRQKNQRRGGVEAHFEEAAVVWLDLIDVFPERIADENGVTNMFLYAATFG